MTVGNSQFSGHRLSIGCPHCGGRARVRTSREVTVLVREAQLQCQNVDCGHTFGAQLQITHTISPSRTPRADVVLPEVRPRQRAINDNSGLEVPPAVVATG